jgi:hypothetical protein
LLQLLLLRLVHLALLQDLDRFLLDRRLARPIAHPREALLVGAEFAVELSQFDIDGVDARVDLQCIINIPCACSRPLLSHTLEIALLSDGLGALLLAPNKRFMVLALY